MHGSNHRNAGIATARASSRRSSEFGTNRGGRARGEGEGGGRSKNRGCGGCCPPLGQSKKANVGILEAVVKKRGDRKNEYLRHLLDICVNLRRKKNQLLAAMILIHLKQMVKLVKHLSSLCRVFLSAETLLIFLNHELVSRLFSLFTYSGHLTHEMEDIVGYVYIKLWCTCITGLLQTLSPKLRKWKQLSFSILAYH